MLLNYSKISLKKKNFYRLEKIKKKKRKKVLLKAKLATLLKVN
jgi:hypothetical protein